MKLIPKRKFEEFMRYAHRLDGNQILPATILPQKINVDDLAAISADLGAITAGTINVASGDVIIDSSGIKFTGTNERLRLFYSATDVGYIGVHHPGTENWMYLRSKEDGIWAYASTFKVGDVGGIYLTATNAGLKVWDNKITDLAAPTADNDAARKVYIDGLLDDVSATDVSGSRAVDTVYQNTSGKLRLVSIGFNWSGAGDIGDVQARIGSASPPTTNASRCNGDQGASLQYAGLTYLVPDNWYHSCVAAGTSPSIDSWVEYDLH